MSLLHQKRMVLILLTLVGLGLGVGLVLYALSQNINLFYTPSELAKAEILPNKRIRIGGMVLPGSVKRQDHLTIEFTITDFQRETTIQYQGIMPDLFKEGQGIVAQGHLRANGQFVAELVLAKHDENYMPPEIAHLQKRDKI